jgi:YegS/Rv2252/BmrU family lipid kinase
MSRKIKLILNPISNHGRAGSVADGLAGIVAEAGSLEWGRTTHAGHAVELARQARQEGCDLVIALGGDGTVHEVVNGLMQIPAKDRPALGVVPIGSGNDFAEYNRISFDPAQALRQALGGSPHQLDMARVTDEHGRTEYFDNTIGIGFDAAVTIRSRRITFVHGFPMYLLATLQTVAANFDCIPMDIETDAETWSQPTLMLTVGNGQREGGGFFVTPQASMTDGLLHYATIGRIGRLTMLRVIPEVMKGTHARFKQFRLGACRTMSIRAEKPLCVHLDGEIYAGFDSNSRQLKIEVLPAALRLVC